MNETYPEGFWEFMCSCGAVAHASEGLYGVLSREADDHRAQGHRASLHIIERNTDVPDPGTSS